MKRAASAVKRVVRKAKQKAKEMEVRVEQALEPSPKVEDSYDNRPPEKAAAFDFAGSPSDQILDSLAAIANRCDDYLAHGPGINFDNRLRARLATPGLKDWVKARLSS